MDRVRAACSAALSLREEHRLRVRLPLADLTIAGTGAARLAPYFDLVRDEVNVKQVSTAEQIAEFATFELKPNARVLGPRVGKEMKTILAAARAGEWEQDKDGVVEVAGLKLEAKEFELRLQPKAGAEGLAVEGLPGHDAVVVLDTRMTEELEAEGRVRDLVRLVQAARKDAGFDVSDRIELCFEDSIRTHLSRTLNMAGGEVAADEYLRDQVLAESIAEGAPSGEDDWTLHEGSVGEITARLSLRRVKV